MDERKLLILDLDETLIHASQVPLDRDCDFTIEDFYVYKRPYLREFIEAVNSFYQIAIWSSGVEYYVLGIVAQLAEEIDPLKFNRLAFLWARSHCNAMSSDAAKDGYFLKDLEKVEEAGYELDNVVIVEDETRKVHRHYDNAIFIAPFRGDTADSDLKKLAIYFERLKDKENIREVEKRFWEREV